MKILDEQIRERVGHRIDEDLLTREDAAWTQAEALIEEKKAKAYDAAVSLFVDLREVAERGGEIARFRTRLATLLGKYPSRRALLERVTQSGLTP